MKPGKFPGIWSGSLNHTNVYLGPIWFLLRSEVDLGSKWLPVWDPVGSLTFFKEPLWVPVYPSVSCIRPTEAIKTNPLCNQWSVPYGAHFSVIFYVNARGIMMRFGFISEVWAPMWENSPVTTSKLIVLVLTATSKAGWKHFPPFYSFWHWRECLAQTIRAACKLDFSYIDVQQPSWILNIRLFKEL